MNSERKLRKELRILQLRLEIKRVKEELGEEESKNIFGFSSKKERKKNVSKG